MRTLISTSLGLDKQVLPEVHPTAASDEAVLLQPRRTQVRGQAIPLGDLAQAAIAGVEKGYVRASRGQVILVIELAGADPGITDAAMLSRRMGALVSLLEKFEQPMMRISAAAPQPLSAYLDPLCPRYLACLKEAPLLAERLRELAGALQSLAERGQAQIGLDYLLFSFTPLSLGMKWFSQSREASRAALARALEDRCRQILFALERAGLPARRVERPEELAALCLASWDAPALLESSLPERAEQPDALNQAVRLPEGTLVAAPKTLEIGDQFLRSWYVHDFGGAVTPACFSALCERHQGTRILQFWEQVPPRQAKRVLRFNRTIEGSGAYLRPATDVRDFDAEARRLQLDNQRARLAFHGEKVFRYRAIIQGWASSLEALEERGRLLEAAFEQLELTCHVATFRQREALISGLPLACCHLDKPERNLDAATLAALIYPGPKSCLAPSGIWLGQTLPAGRLVTRDLFGLQTPVVECVGIMGGGKSAFQKQVLVQLAAVGRRCFVLDSAQHEYRLTVEALGGTVVSVGQPEGPALNPFHFDPLDAHQEGDPFAVGLSLFLGWLAAALNGPLSPTARVCAARAYMRALEVGGIQPDQPKSWHLPAPLLEDFCAALAEEPLQPELGSDDPGRIARLLTYQLWPFVNGPDAALFNRHTDLEVGQAQVVCFDLYNAPEDARAALFYQLLSVISRITLRHQRFEGNLLLIDEGHLALEQESSAAVLKHLARNARKAGLLILISRHALVDTESGSARLIHRTAGATALFGINPQDDASLTDLHLSPYEQALTIGQLGHPGQYLWLTPTEHLHLAAMQPAAWSDWFETRPEVLRARQETRRWKGEAARQAAIHR